MNVRNRSVTVTFLCVFAAVPLRFHCIFTAFVCVFTALKCVIDSATMFCTVFVGSMSDKPTGGKYSSTGAGGAQHKRPEALEICLAQHTPRRQRVDAQCSLVIGLKVMPLCVLAPPCRLLGLLAKHRVANALCGHTHTTTNRTVAGLSVYTVAGTARAFDGNGCVSLTAVSHHLPAPTRPDSKEKQCDRQCDRQYAEM